MAGCCASKSPSRTCCAAASHCRPHWTSVYCCARSCGQGQPLPRAWAARLLPAFERLRRETELDAAVALQAPQGGPNFVAPPPRGLNQTWADDLAVIRATPLEAARHEFAATATGPSARDPRVRAVLDSADAVSRIAEAMDQAWHELLAADWPQLRAICERDVVHRVGVIGEHGWAATIESLHPGVAWRGRRYRDRLLPRRNSPPHAATGSC